MSHQHFGHRRPQLYLQLVRDGNKPAGESSFYSTFTGPAVYTEAKKYQKVEFRTSSPRKADYEHQAKKATSMVQHYFVSAWLLPAPASIARRRGYWVRARRGRLLLPAATITPLDQALAPGASKSVEAKLFVGPSRRRCWKRCPGLELVKGLWLAHHHRQAAVLAARQAAQGVIQLGLGHRGLVLLLKMAVLLAQCQGLRQHGQDEGHQPQDHGMRERLKDNPQQMQQEMMRIYREEKVNPMGGCFPIMIQIPVFIALYWVLLSTVEKCAMPLGWLWIHDLSHPIPFFILPW